VKVQPARIDALLRRPDPALRAVLIYGPDAGLVQERGAVLAGTVLGGTGRDGPPDPFRVAEILGPDLAKDPARLADEAQALSLTGGRRLIRVREAGDGATDAVKGALAGPKTDSLIVLEAGDLTTRSSLRKLAESSEAVAAVPCYQADPQAIAAFARGLLEEAGKTVDREAEAYLGQVLVTDRQLARREIEKLIAWLGEDRRADLDAVRAVIGDSAEQTLDDLVLAVADGRPEAADRAWRLLSAEGTQPVAVLRALQRHFTRLHLAAAHIAAGLSPDQAMARLKPPVFFKAQPRVKAQLARWSPARLQAALDRLVDTEAQVKQTGMPAETLCARTLLSLSSATRR
jgi:DNA polymerase-3 subunit delta